MAETDPRAKKGPLEFITLRGYKSIRELVELPLRSGLNLLIGANGSGKTNFVRFFELLGHMMDSSKGLQSYVAQRGGADAFLFRGMKVTPELSATLVFDLDKYEFTLRAADDRSLFFAREVVRFEIMNWGDKAYDQGQGHRESGPASRYPNNTSSGFENWTVEAIRGWRVHHFHDTSPSARVIGWANVIDHEALHPDAGNLAAFLLHIATEHPEHFARIVETVRQVAPFFGAFQFIRDNDRVRLGWKDRFCELVYGPSQLSDGTLRYICLATLLLQPNPPATLIIDEPELGLHPMAIKLLASLLHDAAGRGQLLVSTQSSPLLDEVGPEHVIVVNQRDGETILERLDAARLRAWLDDYTLGQLWEKDQFGGNP